MAEDVRTPAPNPPHPAPQPAPAPDFNHGWWMRVCTNKTEVQHGLAFQVGPSKDDNDMVGGWNIGQNVNFRVPEDLQRWPNLFFQVTKSNGQADSGKEVNVCVYYDGSPRKSIHFSGEHEWHNVNKDQNGQCDC